MEKLVFISALPYLTLGFKTGEVRSVQFIKHYFSTDDPTVIRQLREYAKAHPSTIAEAGEIELTELVNRYRAAEDKRIQEAEQREKARAAEKEYRKNLHKLSTALRGAETVYR